MADIWIAPKYDFLATDGYTNTHANNVGDNQEHLYRGSSGITTVTMANDLGINMQYHTFYASGAGGINLQRIRYTDGTDTRVDGNLIFIIFQNSQGIVFNTAAGGQYYGLLGRNLVGFTAQAGDALGFVLRSGWWHAII